MPNTRNAKKALRQSRKKYEANKRFKSRLKRWIRKINNIVEQANKEYAEKTWHIVQKLLDKAGKRNIFHKNKVNRIKSRLQKKVFSITSKK